VRILRGVSSDRFHRFAFGISDRMGRPRTFLLALGVVLAWALSGPLFHFSDTWQLVINTGTTVITFLMVFLLQATQNRDARALQLKLDELIRVQRGARNAFADLEHATDEELAAFEREFQRLRQGGLERGEAAKLARVHAHKARPH
jgi:low affinity Fe/Cu permease